MTTVPAAPRRLDLRPLGTGHWLTLSEITYADRDGHPRTWEMASRRKAAGAVVIVPRLLPSGRFVLVRQYRPPVDAPVLEFPAGLLDEGEAPAECARRELAEETGYQGTLRQLIGPCLSSPGMTGESLYLALVDVDEALPANRQPQPRPDDGEHLDVLAVAPAELAGLLQAQEAAGVRLDSRLLCYFLGLGALGGGSG
jgi:ADP-ribose pyrophosphatase